MVHTRLFMIFMTALGKVRVMLDNKLYWSNSADATTSFTHKVLESGQLDQVYGSGLSPS